MVGLITTAKL